MNGVWLNVKVDGDFDQFLKEGCGAPWTARKTMQSQNYGVNELTHQITLSGFDTRGNQVADATSVSTIISVDPDTPDTVPNICQSRRESVIQSVTVDDRGTTHQFKCFWDDKPGATPPYSLKFEQPGGEVFDMERWMEGDVMHLLLSFPQRPHVPPVRRIFRRVSGGPM